MESPKLKCKSCATEIEMKDLQMDPDTRQLICSQCFKLRKKEVEEPKVERPAGWDAEDDYLEKAAKQAARESQFIPKPKFELEPGTNEGMYTCLKCKYKFKYNIREKAPKACPYCGTTVMEIY